MFMCWIYENLLHPKAFKCVSVIKFHQLISHLNHKNQTWPSDVVWWSSEHSSSKLPEWRCIFPATLKLGIQINSTVCHSLSQTDKSKSFFEKQWLPAIEFVSSLLFLTWRITGFSINRDKGWKSKIWERNKKHRKNCECCQIQVPSLNVSFVLPPLSQRQTSNGMTKPILYHKTHTAWQKSYCMSFAMPSYFPCMVKPM